jgi:hypothetical protein
MGNGVMNISTAYDLDADFLADWINRHFCCFKNFQRLLALIQNDPVSTSQFIS